MCDRFLPIEILVWSVSIFLSAILIGMTVGFVWEAIKFILSEFKEGKDKCVK